MKIKTLNPGLSSMLEIELEKGESLKAESGAMVSKTPSVKVSASMDGGFLKSVGRKMAGEKFFMQVLKAEESEGKVIIAPALLGDTILIELNGEQEYFLQKDAFLAGEESIEIDLKVQDIMKGLFSGAGFFVLKASGKGTMAVNAFGSLHEINLAIGEEYIIDNQHLVAWESTLEFNIEKASDGWIDSMFTGEFLVCRFKGPGKIFIQSRNPQIFKEWVSPNPIKLNVGSSGSSGGGATGGSGSGS